MTNIRRLSVVIPVFNEASTIHLILEKLAAVQLPANIQKEVILVDDCSTDGSFDRIEELKQSLPALPVSLFQHETNQGKGAALRTGIKKLQVNC